MDNDSFYKRSNNIKDSNRTYVPNVYREMAAEMYEEQHSHDNEKEKPRCVVELQNRPIVGVLYSISAGIEGELFPIYVGRNTIGSDESCDICLRETSVSAFHGMILARKQMDEAGNEVMNVFLSDTDSMCGTCINGERLGYEKTKCQNGDNIRIGQNYVLLLSLFENTENLSVSPIFERISEKKEMQASIVSSHGMKEYQDNPTTEAEFYKPTKASNENTGGWEYYKPTKKSDSEQDHYNNETIIL